jgi:hypothetical protein
MHRRPGHRPGQHMLSFTHDGVADLRERPFDAPEGNRIRRAPEGCRQLARVPADLDMHLACLGPHLGPHTRLIRLHGISTRVAGVLGSWCL